MTVQHSDAVRNAMADAWETAIGTVPTVEIRTGAQPANCAAADSGTLLVSMTLPSDWVASSASGVKTLLGTWAGTGAALGVAGHYRIKQGGTCHEQGSSGMNVVIATNALTAANGNVLNFASTTGVAIGQNVSGTGVPSGATVVAFTGTTVTLSHSSTAGVANAASITFGPDLVLNNSSIAVSQVVTITSFTRSTGNA